MTEFTEDKPIDSLKYSYRCPECGREGSFLTFANWQAEDLKNGTCTCGRKGPISDFRKATREILALTRGRVLGVIEALGLGLASAGVLSREIRPVFNPRGNAISKRARTRKGLGWGTDTLDKLDELAELIKDRLQDLED